MRKTAVPTYQRRTDNGRLYAAVTLADSKTGRRRTYRLGKYDSERSRERYLQLVAEWEGRGRRLPDLDADGEIAAGGITLTQLCWAYVQDSQTKYSRGHWANIAAVIRVFRRMHGEARAVDVGPNALRLFRESLLRADPDSDPPRRACARATANKWARLIIAIFKWGAGHELLPAGIYESLRTLEPLKRGQTSAREPEPVKPVPEAFVVAAIEHMRPQVRAMVELQLSTGMRPGEVTIMRTRDVDTAGKIWTYRPAVHKTAHHGHDRRVYLGPRAQELLKPWLRRELDEFLFQPAEVVHSLRAERHAKRETPLNQGNRPGTNRKSHPKRLPRDHYTTDTYRRAIARACDRADVEARAAQTGKTVTKTVDSAESAVSLARQLPEAPTEERLIPRWHPHQLRHNHATAVRKRFGVEAARVVLGHRNIDVTELYAERDQAVAAEVARSLG